jgi:hypothetical protein
MTLPPSFLFVPVLRWPDLYRPECNWCKTEDCVQIKVFTKEPLHCHDTNGVTALWRKGYLCSRRDETNPYRIFPVGSTRGNGNISNQQGLLPIDVSSVNKNDFEVGFPVLVPQRKQKRNNSTTRAIFSIEYTPHVLVSLLAFLVSLLAFLVSLSPFLLWRHIAAARGAIRFLCRRQHAYFATIGRLQRLLRCHRNP